MQLTRDLFAIAKFLFTLRYHWYDVTLYFYFPSVQNVKILLLKLTVYL